LRLWSAVFSSKDEIAELEGKLAATRAEALCGYRRIAFGNISDAVKLILERIGLFFFRGKDFMREMQKKFRV